jgi:ATP-dependent Clp protease ATP-binding subunit ClpC
VAKSVADQIGAPLATVLPTDVQREHTVVNELKRLVFGQPQVIETIGRVVRRAFSPLRDTHRPLASLMFGGPSSTGKSHVAQILSDQIYAKTPLVRVNMAEYTEKHSISRLIGAPPGYVGFGDRNQLTDRVRRHPHSVVLLENLDKAHPEVLHVIMEMMESGCLTDGEGNEVNFCSTFIVMTTTAGSVNSTKESLGFGTSVSSQMDQAREKLIVAARELFGEEFITRVDEFIPFSALDKGALRQVAEAAIKEIEDRAPAVQFSVSAAALEQLSGADTARSVRSAVKNSIEPLLCDEIAAGKLKIHIDFSDGAYHVAAAA